MVNKWLENTGFLRFRGRVHQGRINSALRHVRDFMMSHLSLKLVLLIAKLTPEWLAMRLSVRQEQKDKMAQVYESIDWSQTKAYGMGVISSIFINLKGREPNGIVEPGEEYERVRDEIIDDCLKLIKPQADDRDIELSYTKPNTDLPPLKADLNRLRQILLNLLSNAIKYNRPGGKISVDVEKMPEDYLRISVTDTGFGIPQQKQDGLFEPFNRLGREAGEIEGTGIGLTITKQLVELMEGRINFESKEDVGSTFWIELPIAADQAIDIELLETESDEFNAINEKIADGIILYIEDNPANLKLMQAIFARLPNLTLMSAENAELGLNMARNTLPNLILMDINLPGMDGIAALKRLGKDELTKNIPVVAVSAAVMPKEIKRGKTAGFKEYITKPIKVPAIINAIKEHIG